MCSAAADTLRQMKQPNPKKLKFQHWSPALLALQAHLCFITEVKRGLDGQGNKKLWGWLRNKKLAEPVYRWYKALSHLTFENKEQKLEPSNLRRACGCNTKGFNTYKGWRILTEEPLQLKTRKIDKRTLRKKNNE